MNTIYKTIQKILKKNNFIEENLMIQIMINHDKLLKKLRKILLKIRKNDEEKYNEKKE